MRTLDLLSSWPLLRYLHFSFARGDEENTQPRVAQFYDRTCERIHEVVGGYRCRNPTEGMHELIVITALPIMCGRNTTKILTCLCLCKCNMSASHLVEYHKYRYLNTNTKCEYKSRPSHVTCYPQMH
ncbi:hypothetical protein ARMGADRAFT_195169 [Armillaria gallica]|uniref:Uncharacterized protein n=1 Tax=Armillaria gallica TaxID=47427 RepID=A0A2H3DKJ1_ARMGA|nr:hypothetical protein ARMGADRAFT_195169 [Armillaria gallica]